jgi:hypothetical protein
MNLYNPNQNEFQTIIFLLCLPIMFVLIGYLYVILKRITNFIVKTLYRTILKLQEFKKTIISAWTTEKEKKLIFLIKKKVILFHNMFKCNYFYELFGFKKDILRNLNEKKKVKFMQMCNL